MDVRLKECPFCGKDVAELSSVCDCEICANADNGNICPVCYEPELPDNAMHFVVCTVLKGGCGCSTGWQKNAELAIEAWNRRWNEHRTD